MEPMIASLSIVGAVIVAVLILTVAGGTFLPRRYLEPWSKTYYQRFVDPRMRIVAHGLLAASSHNMQPWKVKLDESDPASFLLFADGDRLTPQVDPPARQFTISQGTFLEYCNIAARKLGMACDVALFPDGEYDAIGTSTSMAEKPVARVTLRTLSTMDLPPRQNVPADPLYDSLFLPDTVRIPYLDASLTDEQAAWLSGASSDPAVTIAVIRQPGTLQHLGELAIAAAKVEGKVARISEETDAILRRTEYQKNKYRHGFSVESQGTPGFGRWFLEGLLAIAPSLAAAGDTNERFVKQTITQVEHTPAYVLILTADSSRASQVKAGRAYTRVQLTAQSLGLAVQPLSQVLEEYPEMTDLYSQVHAEYAPHGGIIQMLMRVGKPNKEVPRSMRQDAADLLVK
jgi:hypothetical protein